MREQFNCRLPALTKQQIAGLAEAMGLTQSEVILLAVDRLSVATSNPSAYQPARVAEALAHISTRNPPP